MNFDPHSMDIVPHTDEMGCMCSECCEGGHNHEAPAPVEENATTKSRINSEVTSGLQYDGTADISGEGRDYRYLIEQDGGPSAAEDTPVGQTSSEKSNTDPVAIEEPEAQQARADPNPYNVPNTNGTNYADDPVNGLMGSQVWDRLNLTFSFPTSASDYEAGYASGAALDTVSGLGAQAIGVARSTLDQYAAISGLSFTELTGDSVSGTPGSRIIDADMRFARTDDAGTAYAYYPSDSVYGGDSFYNTNSYNSPTIGNYAYHTFLHEVGHALGLKHGQSTSGPGAVPYEMDSMEFTVMTYRSFVGKELTYGYANESWGYAQSLMMLDIAAIQRLYGANFDTNGGNSVYTFSTTTGEMFINGVGTGTPGGNRVFRTVWDGNGEDTYDLSNYTTNLVIDLAPGGFSEFDADGNFQRSRLDFGYGGIDPVYARGHLFNAMQFEADTRSLIENAIGGSGNDVFTGNVANNEFNGRGGNDSFNDSAGDDTYLGGAGTDTVYFDLSFDAYVFELAGAFLQVVETAIDWVENTIEWLTFSNASYSYQQIVDSLQPGQNEAPVGVDDARTITEDTVAILDVLGNDTDLDSDTLSVSAVAGLAISVGQTVSLASGARVTLLSDGSLRYDQNGAFDALPTGQSATDSFIYRVSDGVASDTATVTITINGVTDNVAPVAVNDEASVDEDATVTGSVLGNDTDANADALSVTSVNGAAPGGTVTLDSGARVVMQTNGTYSYDPNGAFDSLTDGQTATDSFSYTVGDGQGGSDTATVTITINGVSEPSVDAPLVVDFEGLPLGDYLGEAGLNISGITTLADGSLSGTRLGRIEGSTNAELSFSGGTFDLDSASFTSASGRVRVQVQAFDENGAVLGSNVFNLRAGRDVVRSFDATFDNAALIVIDAAGAIYIDDINLVTHTQGGDGSNFSPVAVNDAFSVIEGGALSGSMFTDNGFGSDSDPDGDTLAILSVEGDSDGVVMLASGATVTFAADGSFDYAQNGAFDALVDGQTATDSFEYIVSDGNGGTDLATVHIEVQGVGTPPPPSAVTIIDFEADPNVDGFVFNDLSLAKIKNDFMGESNGDSFTVSRSDGGDFSFDMAMLRAVSGRNITATIEGYDDGVLVATQTLTLTSNRDAELVPVGEEFDSIDLLQISAINGVYVDDMIFTI